MQIFLDSKNIVLLTALKARIGTEDVITIQGIRRATLPAPSLAL